MPDQIAEELIAAGEDQKAIARLEEMLARRDEPGMRLRVATCYHRLGKMGDALAQARRVLETDSSHRCDATLLMAFCLRTLKRFREAARAFQQFAAEWPSDPRSRVARFSAALCCEELDDWVGAIEIYEKLSDDESEFRRGICLERAGRSEEAAEVFEHFVEKYGDSPERLKVSFRLGSLRVRQGRIEEAVEYLEYVIDKGHGTFLGDLAAQLLEKAKLKQADMVKKLQRYNS